MFRKDGRYRADWLGHCTLVLSLVVHQILEGGQEVHQLRTMGGLRVYGGVTLVMAVTSLVLVAVSGRRIALSGMEWTFVTLLVLFGVQSLLAGLALGNPLSYVFSDAARPLMTAVLFVLTLTLCRNGRREYWDLARKCAVSLLVVDMLRLGLYGIDSVVHRTFLRHQSGKLLAPWWLVTALSTSPTVSALVFLVLEVVLHIVSGQRTSTVAVLLMIMLVMSSGPRRTRVRVFPVVICLVCLMMTTGVGRSFFVPRMKAVLLAVSARDFATLDYLSGYRLAEIPGAWQAIEDNLPMSLLAGAGGGARISMDSTGKEKHQIHNTYVALGVRFGVVPALVLLMVVVHLVGSGPSSRSNSQLRSTTRIYLVVLLVTYNFFYGLIGEAEFAIVLGLYRAMCRDGNEGCEQRLPTIAAGQRRAKSCDSLYC